MAVFNPTNPLEVSLLGAQRDAASEQAFIELLMDSEVGVMLDRAALEDGSWDPESAPMVVERPGGFPALAVFTSPSRALIAGLQSKTFQHGRAMRFRQLLRGVQPALGLALNPGSPVGFDMKPEDVAELKKAFGVEMIGKPE